MKSSFSETVSVFYKEISQETLMLLSANEHV